MNTKVPYPLKPAAITAVMMYCGVALVTFVQLRTHQTPLFAKEPWPGDAAGAPLFLAGIIPIPVASLAFTTVLLLTAMRHVRRKI